MSSQNIVLGVEGGGTKTEWVALDGVGAKVVAQGTLPAANLRLISDDALRALLTVLPPDAARAGIYLAGCASASDRFRLEGVARAVWPEATIVVGSDRDSGFAAAFQNGDGISVIAGTGSAVTGRKGGKWEKAGGWGQLLGDKGGGYDLGMQALRTALWQYDIHRSGSLLGESILQALCLNRYEDLSNWAQNADKMSVARLAPIVFHAANNGDAGMLAAIQSGARNLAEYIRAVAARLGFAEVTVRLLGGLFLHHPDYCDLLKDYLSDILPLANVSLLPASGAMGAAWLASQIVVAPSSVHQIACHMEVASLAVAATEQANPRSEHMDGMPARDIVDLFVAEEAMVSAAIHECREKLAAGAEMIASALQAGGRLFYIGAGTSGRLGILDASEIPPTFGTPPEMVQGIIAGGVRALYSAVEGAEDQAEIGALSLIERGLRACDIVCGISASGRAPFVLGALAQATKTGAKTLLLSCNPQRQHAVSCDVEIDLRTGAELLAGSTRLKAGTATKVALNILSTIAMIRLGRVKGNLMINVNPSNIKLRDRAIRLVAHLRQCSYTDAGAALERNGWNVRASVDR